MSNKPKRLTITVIVVLFFLGQQYLKCNNSIPVTDHNRLYIKTNLAYLTWYVVDDHDLAFSLSTEKHVRNQSYSLYMANRFWEKNEGKIVNSSMGFEFRNFSVDKNTDYRKKVYVGLYFRHHWNSEKWYGFETGTKVLEDSDYARDIVFGGLYGFQIIAGPVLFDFFLGGGVGYEYKHVYVEGGLPQIIPDPKFFEGRVGLCIGYRITK